MPKCSKCGHRQYHHVDFTYKCIHDSGCWCERFKMPNKIKNKERET